MTGKSGKTIRIYLADGSPNGVLTAEIINWTGKVIVAPRSRLADLARRDEVRRTGVYFLIGPDPDTPNRNRVYIGEGDNVIKRLAAHDKDESKDFWTKAALVTSKDENLTKSHGRFLESRLIAMAGLAGRATVTNGTAPAAPPLPEPDQADMEFFIRQIQMVLPVLGIDVLQPRPSSAVIEPGREESPVFSWSIKEASARAMEIDGEMIVLKGSTARKQGIESWTSYKALRDQLVESGKLVSGSDPNLLVFTEDVEFASPSAAAAVVAAGNTNGRKSWRIVDTKETYGDWQERKLKQAEESQ
jgi:Domain of unknown function (DUF4357)